MGTKKGSFLNIAGETVAVTFSGDNIADNDSVVFGASPVVLSMSGEAGEFVPVKYVTGTVSILCDGDEFLDLMTTEALDVRVRIDNETTGAIEFLGVVSPNTYQQSIGDLNSELAVEIVDYIGAMKLLPYPRVGEGFALLTLQEIVAQILGTYCPEVVSVYWPYTIRLKKGADPTMTAASTPYYYKMRLSEYQLFDFPEPYSPLVSEGRGDVLRYPQSTPDAYTIIENIAQSLLVTCVLVGDELRFIDYYCVMNGTTLPQAVVTARESWADTYEDLVLQNTYTQVVAPAAYCEPSCDVSTVAKYDFFTLSSQYKDSIVVYPNLSDSSLILTDSVVEAGTEDEETVYTSQCTSLVYDVPTLRGDAYHGFSGGKFFAQIYIGAEDAEYNGCPGVPFNSLTTWKARLLLLARYADAVNTFGLSAAVRPALVNAAPLALRLSLTAAYMLYSAYNTADPTLYDAGKYLAGEQSRATIRIQYGDLYYSVAANNGSGGWVSAEYRNLLYVNTATRTLTDDFYIASNTDTTVRQSLQSAIVLPRESVGGALDVRIIMRSPSGTSAYHGLMIAEFSVSVVPADEWQLSTPDVRKGNDLTLGDSSAAHEYDAVALPYNVLWFPSRGALGTYVEGVQYMSEPGETNYSGESLGDGYACNLCYYLHADSSSSYYGTSIERLREIVNIGGNYSVEVTLDERLVDIKPYTRLNYIEKFAGTRIVVSYERDLREKTIKIVAV